MSVSLLFYGNADNFRKSSNRKHSDHVFAQRKLDVEGSQQLCRSTAMHKMTAGSISELLAFCCGPSANLSKCVAISLCRFPFFKSIAETDDKDDVHV